MSTSSSVNLPEILKGMLAAPEIARLLRDLSPAPAAPEVVQVTPPGSASNPPEVLISYETMYRRAADLAYNAFVHELSRSNLRNLNRSEWDKAIQFANESILNNISPLLAPEVKPMGDLRKAAIKALIEQQQTSIKMASERGQFSYESTLRVPVAIRDDLTKALRSKYNNTVQVTCKPPSSSSSSAPPSDTDYCVLLITW